MYGWLLFIHVAGVAIWLGSIVAVASLLLSLKRQLAQENIKDVVVRTIKVFNRITHPSATFVLLSGIILLIQSGWDHSNLPFWLKFMEQAGALVILLFIIIVSIMGRKLTKKLANGDPSQASKSITVFVNTLFISALAVLAVVLIVSLKL